MNSEAKSTMSVLIAVAEQFKISPSQILNSGSTDRQYSDAVTAFIGLVYNDVEVTNVRRIARWFPNRRYSGVFYRKDSFDRKMLKNKQFARKVEKIRNKIKL